MKICFSIDALADSGKQCWRLQQDGTSWRVCQFAEALAVGDWRAPTVEAASEWHGKRLKKAKDSLTPQARPGRFDFLARGIFAHAIVHRLSPAAIPDKAQMRQQLAEHAAGTPWLLYLNLAGQFAMLDTRSTPLIGNLHIAVRGEIASSPEYVGEHAAEKTEQVDALYHQFIAGWWNHLQNSRTGVFTPDMEQLRPLEEYLQHIEQWQPEPAL